MSIIFSHSRQIAGLPAEPNHDLWEMYFMVVVQHTSFPELEL